MKFSFSKQTKGKPVFNYSYKWFEIYPDRGLHELYQDFLESNPWDKEVFFIDLSVYLRSSFEISYDDIQHPVEHYTCVNLSGASKQLINEIEKKDLMPLFEYMIPVYIEVLIDQTKNLIQERCIIDSLNSIRNNAKTTLENIFSRLIINSAMLVRNFVLNDNIYRFADSNAILFDIIKESIKKESFSVHTFTLAHGTEKQYIDKVHEIAIMHTAFVLDRLSYEEKLALIPTLKQYLHNEQNFKVAKRFDYKGIDGLEVFYKTFLGRFEKERDEKIKKEKKVEDENKKMFFQIGSKKDINPKNVREHIEKKELQFKNLFIRMKHKFLNNPSASDFESLFNPGVKYYEKFNWIGSKKEFIILIKFLKEKGIVRQTKIQQVLNARFLINGKEISNTDSQSSIICQARLDYKSMWVKSLVDYLV
jgi:hypothetical protein